MALRPYLTVRGMARLLVAVGFVNGTGEHKDEIKLSHIVNLSWVLEEWLLVRPCNVLCRL